MRFVSFVYFHRLGHRVNFISFWLWYSRISKDIWTFFIVLTVEYKDKISNEQAIYKFFTQLICSSFNKELETHQNSRNFGSSMAEQQQFGCLDTRACNCKQNPSLRFPIEIIIKFKKVIQARNSVLSIVFLTFDAFDFITSIFRFILILK